MNRQLQAWVQNKNNNKIRSAMYQLCNFSAQEFQNKQVYKEKEGMKWTNEQK